MERRDAIVIGAGITGAAAAWSLARRGKRVTVLEQFARGHVRGSSHGGSRIFRLAYPDPFWVRLACEALGEWRELEAATGVGVLVQTGTLDHGDPAELGAVVNALDAEHVPTELLPAEVARERWPGMRFDGPALFQAGGGRIAAGAALLTLLEQTLRDGGELRWETPVRALEIEDDLARVVTDSVTYEAEVVVVAAGAWVAGLVGDVLGLPPLRVTQESLFHFAPVDPRSLWPSFIHHGGGLHYGLETPGEGVKVAEHGSGPAVTADDRDFTVDPGSRERVVQFVEQWMPGLRPVPVTEATCLYTSTPTEDFVVDRVGPLLVASPCSGHGFKFAPLVGRMIADQAEGKDALDRFSLTRRG